MNFNAANTSASAKTASLYDIQHHPASLFLFVRFRVCLSACVRWFLSVFGMRIVTPKSNIPQILCQGHHKKFMPRFISLKEVGTRKLSAFSSLSKPNTSSLRTNSKSFESLPSLSFLPSFPATSTSCSNSHTSREIIKYITNLQNNLDKIPYQSVFNSQISSNS